VPIEITPDHVVLQPIAGGESLVHPCDFVLICTGFRADMTLFKVAGVQLEGERRVPQHDPDTMETNVPGLYLVGTAVAGMLQDRYRIFIENSHPHVAKVVQAITGQQAPHLGTIPARNYELALKQIEAN
jgi:thioredoxin reductase (NADPH)